MEVRTRNGRTPVRSFDSHREALNAQTVPHAFRDRDDELLILTDVGWLATGYIHYSEDYPTYPVTPLGPDEEVVIR